jgi:hypothetical protein
LGDALRAALACFALNPLRGFRPPGACRYRKRSRPVTTTTNIDKVKKLRAFTTTLRGATERWERKYADRKHYDKQGFQFAIKRDTSWNAFSVPTLAFEAYIGTYGSSSVGRDWSVDQDLVNQYFAKALNEHKQAIFDSMAAMAETDANSLRDAASAELDALRALLGEAEKEAA